MKTSDRWIRPIMTIAATFGVGITACVAAGTYNPDKLGNEQVARIAQICETTMGLKPSEPPVSGVHPGTPHLDTYVSHYQGCIASLSDTVQRASDIGAVHRADADCRANGLQSESSELAMCILTAARDYAATGSAPVTTRSSPAENVTATRVGSFFYASPEETLNREQNACALLGLAPFGDEFAHCVKGLQTTFFAIDNPLD
jgi:hypothetical protein